MGGGAPGGRPRSRSPWIFAGVASVALIGWLIWFVNRGVEVAPPPAGRTGGANAPSTTGDAGTPPDISQMSGRERFLRLHDRIMDVTKAF